MQSQIKKEALLGHYQGLLKRNFESAMPYLMFLTVLRNEGVEIYLVESFLLVNDGEPVQTELHTLKPLRI